MAVMLLNTGEAPVGTGPYGSPTELELLNGNVLSPALLPGTTLIVSLPGDEVLVLPSTDAHFLPRGADELDLRRRVAAAAGAWRRERHRVERRNRMPDWLMRYVDDVNGAATPQAVYVALMSCTPLVMDAYLAVVYELVQAGAEPDLRAVRDASDSIPTLPARAASALAGPVVVSRVEAHQEAGGAHGILAPVFVGLAAAQLLCRVVVEGAWLVLAERRHDRVFTSEDRDLLEWLLEQARRRLAQIGPLAP